jgi:hypothetical protein
MHDVAKATATLFALFISITMIGTASGKPSLLAPSQNKPLTLSMLTSCRPTPIASLDCLDCPAVISEQAELQPECLPSFFSSQHLSTVSTAAQQLFQSRQSCNRNAFPSFFSSNQSTSKPLKLPESYLDRAGSPYH